MNSTNFETHGLTGASRPLGSSEFPGAPRAGGVAGVSNAPSVTAPLPTAEAVPAGTTFDHTDSAEAADPSALVVDEEKKTKCR